MKFLIVVIIPSLLPVIRYQKVVLDLLLKFIVKLTAFISPNIPYMLNTVEV